MDKYLVYIYLVILIIGGCKKDDLTDVEDFFYLRNNGSDMPVYIEGNVASRVFIILLHGGPGDNSQTYNQALSFFSDPLEDNYAMVYYDQRGSGISQGHYKKSDLTIEQYVEDLDRLISLLGYKYGADIDLYLMGHSWGGTLGTAYLLTENYQTKIEGWIEIDGAHNFMGIQEIIDAFNEVGDEQIDAGNDEDFWQEVIDYCEKINPEYPSDENISKLNSYGYDAEKKLSDAEVLVFEGYDDPFRALFDMVGFYTVSSNNPLMSYVNLICTSSGLGMFDVVKEIDYTSRLYQITVPTLLIWGEYDLVVPRELGMQAYNRINAEQKELYIIENSGHSPMVNKPKVVADIIIDFVEEIQE